MLLNQNLPTHPLPSRNLLPYLGSGVAYDGNHEGSTKETRPWKSY